MSRRSTVVETAPEVVWDILADPATYENWVVGNRAIRGYDDSWPEPGSKFHHGVGFGPLVVKDKTVALESEPGDLRRLKRLAEVQAGAVLG